MPVSNLVRADFWRNRPLWLWRTLVSFARNLVRDFFDNGCQKSAAALTYMTLFAIVPTMTVMFAMFSVIPAFSGLGEQLQAMVFSHFIPESGQELQSYLASFSAQARSLTGVGVGMLVVTAYLMLTNIEKTFNAIWGVDKSRKGLASFLLYWAVLSIGPLLLGAALAMNTYVLSLRILFEGRDTLGFAALAFSALPVVLTALAFTLLFVAVPNCRVPVRYALVGGVMAAVCFELLKSLFSKIVANSNWQLVYGAFAVVPLFLLWVNLVWTVILGGAILVRTLAERQYVLVDGKATHVVAALKCLALLRERSLSGGAISDSDCYAMGLGVVHWQQLRHTLEDARWIAVTSNDRYVLSRDLRAVTLWDLARLVRLPVHDLDCKLADPPDAAWFQAYLGRRQRVAESAKDAFGISIEDLLAVIKNPDP